MQKNASVQLTESQQELERLRTVILGEEHHLITDAVNEQARDIVGEVLTEALHDRQKKDGSIDKVLLPIVEASVEHSVVHNSDRLISYLYPLLGDLIRKSVGAFLSNFIEKTNQLIEYSFTVKGLKWRFKAWRAGISFTQYVLSQTYNYRVEHVLLIHKETGLLLKSVNLEQQSQNDIDLISSMLSAINDFVGDSFQTSKDGQKEQLQTVSTDSFKLLIRSGPSAIIVAAVTGNPPQQVSEQLQITLEEIHRLYIDELDHFDGDSSLFKNAENQLRDCLLTEEIKTELSSNKKPWFAWLLITIVTIFIAFAIESGYQRTQLKKLIMNIDQQPGIVVMNINVKSENDITLDVMRDPNAIPIEQWFNSHQLSFKSLNLIERRYRSLSPEILNRRVEAIISHYPDLSFHWKNEQLSLLGNIDIIKYQELTTQLSDIGITSRQLQIQQLSLDNSNDFAQSTDVNQQIFKDLIGKISTIQLNFEVNSNQVTPAMQMDLKLLAEQFRYLIKLAKQLNINIGLLLMGASDNSGNRNTNKKLSMMRAESAAIELTHLGLNRVQMFVTSLGQIDIEDVKNTSRKVMFNVIYIDNKIKD